MNVNCSDCNNRYNQEKNPYNNYGDLRRCPKCHFIELKVKKNDG